MRGSTTFAPHVSFRDRGVAVDFTVVVSWKEERLMLYENRASLNSTRIARRGGIAGLCVHPMIHLAD